MLTWLLKALAVKWAGFLTMYGSYASLTLSARVVSNGYTSKCSGPYWSNQLFYPHMPICMLRIYCLLFVCNFLCPQDLFKGYLRRGLALGNEIWHVGEPRWVASCLPFGELWQPLRPNSDKSIMHWTIVSQVQQIGRTAANHVWQTGHRWLGDGDRHVGIYASLDN